MQALEIYNAEFKPSAQLKEPYSLACLQMVAADTQKEAEIQATSMYQSFLGILTDTREPQKPPVTPEQMDAIWTPEQKAYMMQMLSLAMIGDAQFLEKNLAYFIGATGVNEIMVSTPIFDFEKKKHSLKIFAEVMNNLSM